MIRQTSLAFAALALVSPALLALAGPKEDVQDAIKKVSESASYGWKLTVDAEFGGGVTEGKAQKDGLISLMMERSNVAIQLIFKGDNGAINSGEGWQSLQEVLAAPPEQLGLGRFIARTA